MDKGAGFDPRPLVLGLGGTTRTDSSSERMLRRALGLAAARGARTLLLAGPDLLLPIYAPDDPVRPAGARRLVAALRSADAVLIASPGYHGSMSGLVKNALDYAEDLRDEARPYLDGRPVGLIASAHGWQAACSTLSALRTVVHALRGWPTPMGVAVNAAGLRFDGTGLCSEPAVETQLATMVAQTLTFLERPRLEPHPV